MNPLWLPYLWNALVAWAAAFLAALWMALVLWAYRDMRARHRARWAALLAAVTVLVLNIPGVVVYLLLRPRYTLEEAYRRALEEEALLETLDEVQRCPGCTRRVQPDWVLCPSCFTRLKKTCHHCGRLMELAWTVCPYCGTPVPGARKEGLVPSDVLPVQSEQPPDAEAPDEDAS